MLNIAITLFASDSNLLFMANAGKKFVYTLFSLGNHFKRNLHVDCRDI